MKKYVFGFAVGSLVGSVLGVIVAPTIYTVIHKAADLLDKEAFKCPMCGRRHCDCYDTFEKVYCRCDGFDEDFEESDAFVDEEVLESEQGNKNV